MILQINYKLVFFNKRYTNYYINDIKFQSKEKIIKQQHKSNQNIRNKTKLFCLIHLGDIEMTSNVICNQLLSLQEVTLDKLIRSIND